MLISKKLGRKLTEELGLVAVDQPWMSASLSLSEMRVQLPREMMLFAQMVDSGVYPDLIVGENVG